jgi:hypothetical protein
MAENSNIENKIVKDISNVNAFDSIINGIANYDSLGENILDIIQSNNQIMSLFILSSFKTIIKENIIKESDIKTIMELNETLQELNNNFLSNRFKILLSFKVNSLISNDSFVTNSREHLSILFGIDSYNLKILDQFYSTKYKKNILYLSWNKLNYIMHNCKDINIELDSKVLLYYNAIEQLYNQWNKNVNIC